MAASSLDKLSPASEVRNSTVHVLGRVVLATIPLARQKNQLISSDLQIPNRNMPAAGWEQLNLRVVDSTQAWRKHL